VERVEAAPRAIGNTGKGIVSNENDTLISTEKQGFLAERKD
jgi:hypothetical protein